MDRRQFIQTTMAVAAAAAVPFAVHAMSVHDEVPIEQTEVPKKNPYQRYVTALALFDELVGIHWKLEEEPKGSEAGKVLYEDLHAKIDELFGYVHENFVIPSRGNKAARRQIKVMFQGGYEDPDTKKWIKVDNSYETFRKVPPVIMEEVWPPMMMKLILRDYGMPINHRKMPQFKTFHDRYGFLILEV